MDKKSLLSKLHIRKTPIREQILTLFLDNEGVAFSEAEINQMFNNSLDRISIYRTIRTLTKKAVIHKVICDGGVLKYAHKPTTKINSTHAHFECTDCGQVVCLSQKGSPKIDLPRRFQQETIHTLIKGLCSGCNASN